ncbi:transcription factor bHLH162-like isoform X2 [Cynara cardunculus var. scolymus]|uniref:transcription factor bHLH162-like isoform X2 n=1 Tax=Cynara cardunculus var. scolymus TaxID=59895 RepID=UPI000D62A915|nr:transcription factor bHLH162-like isoform X2 [Cynara cardunculus var. scolymus]
MMKKYDGGSRKLERKTIEKNRRIHMKNLCYKLTSVVPSLSSQPYKCFPQDSLFDQSAAYIKQLQNRIEQLKEKRDATSRLLNNGTRNDPSCYDQPAVSCDGVRLPTVEVKEFDDGLQVNLTSGSERNFTFSDVVRIVEDGGAEVVKSGYTTVGGKVFYTLHAQNSSR